MTGQMTMATHWYVIHTYSGHEKQGEDGPARAARRAHRHGKALFGEVLIPEENVTEIVKGQQAHEPPQVLPGYILVQMELTTRSGTSSRTRPKVTGFVGAGTQPTPIPEHEVQRMLGQAAQREAEAEGDRSRWARTCA